MYAPALKIFQTKPPFIPAPTGTGFSGGKDIKTFYSYLFQWLNTVDQ